MFIILLLSILSTALNNLIMSNAKYIVGAYEGFWK